MSTYICRLCNLQTTSEELMVEHLKTHADILKDFLESPDFALSLDTDTVLEYFKQEEEEGVVKQKCRLCLEEVKEDLDEMTIHLVSEHAKDVWRDYKNVLVYHFENYIIDHWEDYVKEKEIL